MAQTGSLGSRIDAEFSAVEERTKKFQSEQLEKHKGREKRLEQLGKTFDELREIWRPRLELLMKKFGDRVKATPRIVPATREVTFDVQSPLAAVRLKFSGFTDRDIEKLLLTYDLEIIPVLMKASRTMRSSFRSTRLTRMPSPGGWKTGSWTSSKPTSPLATTTFIYRTRWSRTRWPWYAFPSLRPPQRGTGMARSFTS
jgi:hypothetical protein